MLYTRSCNHLELYVSHVLSDGTQSKKRLRYHVDRNYYCYYTVYPYTVRILDCIETIHIYIHLTTTY